MLLNVKTNTIQGQVYCILRTFIHIERIYLYIKGLNEIDSEPPFYTSDPPHLSAKLRNLLLKTIYDPQKLPFGRYFIQHTHLQQIFNTFGKDKHFLTANVVNPSDKQNEDL